MLALKGVGFFFAIGSLTEFMCLFAWRYACSLTTLSWYLLKLVSKEMMTCSGCHQIVLMSPPQQKQVNLISWDYNEV